MTAIPYAIDTGAVANSGAPSVQTYARVAGLLLALSMIFGFLGEWYIPSRFMSTDPDDARSLVFNEGSPVFQ